MKSKILNNLRGPSFLHSTDGFWILFSGLLWIVLTRSRPVLIDLKCAQVPSPCTPESVFFLDRIALGIQDLRYMHLSNWTQAFCGVLSLLVVIGFFLKKKTSKQELFTDLGILIQTVLWNGLFTEIFRIAIQRPRPFVYDNPAEHGPDPAHYTSFYSGHTSFAATTITAMIIILYSRNSSPVIFRSLSSLGVTAVVLTGLFRVLSERHFPTDVLAGALAGSLTALGVALVHRKKTELLLKTHGNFK